MTTTREAGERTPWRLYVLLFFLFMTVYGVFVEDVGPNQLSRLNLTLALAHEGRLEIDTYTANAIDRAYYNGHYYTDKAPLISFLAYPVYQAVRALQNLDAVNLDTRLMLTYLLWLLNVSINVPLTALLLLLFLHVARTLQPEGEMPWLAAFALAFGSLLFPYATMLFGHNVAAFFGFAPFVVALWVRLGRLSERWLFVAGLLAGLGVLAEYPNGVFALALVAYVWGTMRRPRAVLWVIAGGVGPALALAAYNWAAFDHPLRFSYMFHAAPWGAEHRKGLLGVRLPSPVRMVEILFSPRGLFFLSPVTVLAPVAYRAMWRRREWRAEFWMSLGIPLAFLLLNSGYFYTLGGSAPGPRFLVPTLPYLFLPFAFLGRGWRWPLVFLAGVSALIQFVIVVTDPLVGRFSNPLISYWIPMLVTRQARVGIMLRQRYPMPYSFTLLLILGLMVLGPVAVWVWYRLAKGWRERVITGLVVLVVGLYVAAAFPLDVRRPTQVPAFYLRPSPPVRDNPPDQGGGSGALGDYIRFVGIKAQQRCALGRLAGAYLTLAGDMLCTAPDAQTCLLFSEVRPRPSSIWTC